VAPIERSRQLSSKVIAQRSPGESVGFQVLIEAHLAAVSNVKRDEEQSRAAKISISKTPPARPEAYPSPRRTWSEISKTNNRASC